MPWTPPKKVTVVITLFAEIVGLIFGLVAIGVLHADFGIDPFYVGLIGTFICFIGWLFLLLGVIIRGL